MFDFLKSVIGKGKQAGIPSTEADDVTAREISVDLKRLEAISLELAQRTIVYVLTGEGSSVLLQLEQQAKTVQTALSQYQHAAMPTATQAEVQTAIKARNNVLVRQYGPEATWIRRYLEVLTLPQKGSRWGMFSHQGPSPLWLRGFFAQTYQLASLTPLAQLLLRTIASREGDMSSAALSSAALATAQGLFTL
jgi:hypothetical protein